MLNISFNGFVTSVDNFPSSLIPILQKELSFKVDPSYFSIFKSKTFLPLSSQDSFQYIFHLDENNTLSFLTGLLHLVLPILKKYKYSFSFTPNYINTPIPEEYVPSSFLMSHQIDIVKECLSKKRGIIKSPTGSGKAFSIIEISRVLNINNNKILITVPTVALLHQFKQEFTKFYNLRQEEVPIVGLIGDGYLELDNNITVAIPDTIVSRLENEQKEDIISFLSNINALISDECHTTGNPSYVQICQYMGGRRISCGCSATPWCSTGANLVIKGLFSDIIINKEETLMVDKGVILLPEFRYYEAPSTYLSPKLLSMDYSHWVYNQLYDAAIVRNSKRNDLIVQLTLDYINQNTAPFILIVNKVGTVVNKTTLRKSISHADILQELFKLKGVELPILSGATKKKDRDILFSSLSSFSIPGLIAGPKILTAGVDIKSIGCVILAAAGSSDINFIQRVGRALRTLEGKSKPIVIDFLDPASYFKKQSQERVKIAQQVYGKNSVLFF